MLLLLCCLHAEEGVDRRDEDDDKEGVADLRRIVGIIVIIKKRIATIKNMEGGSKIFRSLSFLLLLYNLLLL